MPGVKVTVKKTHENGMEQEFEFEGDELIGVEYKFAGHVFILGGGFFVKGVHECLKLAQQFFKIWPGGN